MDYNYTDRKLLRAALVDMCVQIRPTLHITLTYEQKTSFHAIYSTLGYFSMKLDKLMLGENFYNYTAAERSRGVAFLEHLDTNTHLHAVISTPNDERLLRNSDYLNEMWRRRTGLGSIHVQRITKTPRRLYGYITKEADWERDFILLSEYHRR